MTNTGPSPCVRKPRECLRRFAGDVFPMASTKPAVVTAVEPGIDQVRTQLPFEQLKEGLFIGWRFRWPQEALRRVKARNALLVHDSQRSSILGSFVTVTLHLRADGVGASEALGQLLQTGAGDQGPSAAAGSNEVERGEGLEGLVTAPMDRRVVAVRSKLRCGSTGLFEGLRRRIRRGGRVRGTRGGGCAFPPLASSDGRLGRRYRRGCGVGRGRRPDPGHPR